MVHPASFVHKLCHSSIAYYSVHPHHVLCLTPVLNELFNVRHILTEEECSEVVYRWQWEVHLVLVLAVKPMEAVEEATKVMKLYDLGTQRLHGELFEYVFMDVLLACLSAIIYQVCVFRPALLHVR